MTSEFAMWFSSTLAMIRLVDTEHKIRVRREEAIRWVEARLKSPGTVDQSHPIVNALLCAHAVVVLDPINPAGVVEIFGHMLRAWEELEKTRPKRKRARQRVRV
jgi:hypothetical protein